MEKIATKKTDKDFKTIASSAYNKYIKGGKLLIRIAVYLFMFSIAFVFVYPFLYMLVTSIKSPWDLYDITVDWIPTEFYFRNYIIAFKNLNYFPHLLVSVIVTVSSIVIHIICDSFFAYGFARYKFKGKNLIFALVIFSMVVPTEVIILPKFFGFSALNMTNSYLPIYLPLILGNGLRSGLFIFLFRQYFIGMPKSIEEAAKIDGCGYMSVYWKITMPMASNSILVSAVLALVWHWNDYYEPSIYLNRIQLWTLPSMLPSIYSQYQQAFGGLASGSSSTAITIDTATAVSEGVVMAATFMVILPVLISYSILQKKFMESVERTGLVE